METTPSPAGARPNIGAALSGVVLAPSRAFAEIDRGARWIWPVLLTGLLAIAGTLISAPAMDVAIEPQIEKMRAAGQEVSTQMQASMRMIGVVSQSVMMPIAAGVSALVGALLVFFTTRSLRLGFKPLYRLLAYTGIVGFGLNMLLGGILTRVRWGGGQVESAADLYPRMGLDLVGGDGWVRAFMSMVNPFSIWSGVLVVLGVAYMAKRPARAVAGPVVAGLVLGALLGALMMGWQLSRATS
jgi:hypothetical protein